MMMIRLVVPHARYSIRLHEERDLNRNFHWRGDLTKTATMHRMIALPGTTRTYV